VTERAETGAEVVQREPAAQAAQFVDDALGARRVAHCAGFGDLETQAIGPERTAVQALGDESDEALVEQRGCRQVDRAHRDVGRGVREFLQPVQRQPHDLAIDLDGELESFGRRDEAIGNVQRATARVAHAQQQFEMRA